MTFEEDDKLKKRNEIQVKIEKHISELTGLGIPFDRAVTAAIKKYSHEEEDVVYFQKIFSEKFTITPDKTIPEKYSLFDEYQIERSSTSAMISGILIMICSVAILFWVPDILTKILGFIISLMFGWGLAKLGSRRVLTDPKDVLKRIQRLEKNQERKN